MPSSHPIPSLASIALSLYTSTRTVERLPVVTEIYPYERACFVVTMDNGVSEAL